MITQISGGINVALNSINLGWLLKAHRDNKKALDKQNIYAVGMIIFAIGVSVGNTWYITNQIKKQGANDNNGTIRAFRKG